MTTGARRSSASALVIVLVLVGSVAAAATAAAAAARRLSASGRESPSWSAPGPFEPAVLSADHEGVVAEGYLGDVIALDTHGREEWRYDFLNTPVYWRPALGPAQVVVSLGDRLAALDRQS